ncbi:MAG: DUF547 domain-containing protein [Pseudomonadota bacterium]
MNGLLLGTLLLSQTADFDHGHRALADFYAPHVAVSDDGAASTFAYAGAGGDRASLDAYLDSVARVTTATYNDWTPEQRLAFLINVYNASAIELLLDQETLPDSIRDIGSVFRPVWKRRFIDLFGEQVSLDNVEHGRIREDFEEPRIHVAVNCASCGCPALQPAPYTAGELEQQLEAAMRAFLGDRSRNRVDLDRRTVEVSKIFDWFESDFLDENGDIEPYFARYADALADTEEERALLLGGDYRLRYTDYDWTINAPGRCE